MAKLSVFDPAMCCSTGVCGPAVDPVLPRFAADLDWLRRQGVEVERYNLAQQPGAFAENGPVKALLDAGLDAGDGCLPLILVDGQVASIGRYPTRDELARMAGVGVSGGDSVWSPAIEELVAIGASIACNCMPCLRYHTDRARSLGLGDEDMARAVALAETVKQTPAKLILELANRYLNGRVRGVVEPPACCDSSIVESPACCGGSI